MPVFSYSIGSVTVLTARLPVFETSSGRVTAITLIDLAGTALLFGGVIASGLISAPVGALVVAGYYLVSAEAFLATHSRGLFKMSFAGVGPTELRLLLIAGAVAVVDSPVVSLFGIGPVKLWDLGGSIGTAGMVTAFVVSSIRNGAALYLEETKR